MLDSGNEQQYTKLLLQQYKKSMYIIKTAFIFLSPFKIKKTFCMFYTENLETIAKKIINRKFLTLLLK